MTTTYFVLGTQLSLPGRPAVVIPPAMPIPLGTPELPETTETSVYDVGTDTVLSMLSFPQSTHKQPVKLHLISIAMSKASAPGFVLPADANAWMGSPHPKTEILVQPGVLGPYHLSIPETEPSGGQIVLEFTRPS